MKKLIILLAIFLNSCGMFTTGQGVFNGTLVDVSWEGLIFDSCEMQFQFGQQSSSISKASSRNKNLCDEMQKQVGKQVEVKYKTWVHPCCLRMDTNYEIE